MGAVWVGGRVRLVKIGSEGLLRGLMWKPPGRWLQAGQAGKQNGVCMGGG
jgi:hypothetical protein